jgi:hypothetical protein
LNYNPQFNSKNLIRITNTDKTGLKRPLVYASFVRNNGLEEDFAIWDYDLKDNEYYKQKSNKTITKDESNTLPTSKVYGENLYKAIQKFGISESEARSKYGKYTIKQWDELLNTASDKEMKYAIEFFTDGGIGMKYIIDKKFDAKYFESSMKERLNKSKLGRAESLIKLWSRELGINPSKYIDGLIIEDIDFIKDSTERAKYLFSIMEKGGKTSSTGWKHKMK